MEVSRIIDFTSLLREGNNKYCFNPSIAKLRDNLYLCSYRCFNRYKSVITGKYKGNPIFDPNHPWLGSDKSTTWWKIVDGEDDTGFVILEIEKQTVIKVKEIKLVEDGKIFGKLKGIDARLLSLGNGYFIVSYNTFVKDSTELRNNTCENGCLIIAARLLKLEKEKLYFYKENIMCPSISNSVEKNWSFWYYENTLHFSYGLVPYHNVYRASVNLSGDIICSPTPMKEYVGYYGHLEDIYNANLAEKLLFISVTTPAIPNRTNPNRYIGVGHVKYKNREGLINLIRRTPAGLFYNNTRSFKRHPIFDYLMFIYEFDPENGNITRITDMFIPENSDYILSFPSGIVYDEDNNLMISYGDHDSACKLIIIRRDLIDKMLKPIVLDSNRQIISPLPTNLYFFSFPTKCLNKAGICELILS